MRNRRSRTSQYVDKANSITNGWGHKIDNDRSSVKKNPYSAAKLRDDRKALGAWLPNTKLQDLYTILWDATMSNHFKNFLYPDIVDLLHQEHAPYQAAHQSAHEVVQRIWEAIDGVSTYMPLHSTNVQEQTVPIKDQLIPEYGVWNHETAQKVATTVDGNRHLENTLTHIVIWSLLAKRLQDIIENLPWWLFGKLLKKVDVYPLTIPDRIRSWGDLVVHTIDQEDQEQHVVVKVEGNQLDLSKLEDRQRKYAQEQIIQRDTGNSSDQNKTQGQNKLTVQSTDRSYQSTKRKKRKRIITPVTRTSVTPVKPRVWKPKKTRFKGVTLDTPLSSIATMDDASLIQLLKDKGVVPLTRQEKKEKKWEDQQKKIFRQIIDQQSNRPSDWTSNTHDGNIKRIA